MHRPALALPAAVLATLLVAACSSGEPGDVGLPTYTPGTGSPSAGTTTSAPPSATTSATPEPDPSPWTALPTISEGPNKGVHTGIVLASSVAETEEEKAAVDAYVAFWQTIVQAGYDVKVTQAQLAKVSSGAPQDVMRDYVAGLRRKGARTVGWLSINVTKITVGKNSVLLNACLDNGTYDVDRESGRRLEKTTVGYDGEAGVRKVDGRLVVTYSRAPDRSEPCPTAGA